MTSRYLFGAVIAILLGISGAVEAQSSPDDSAGGQAAIASDSESSSDTSTEVVTVQDSDTDSADPATATETDSQQSAETSTDSSTDTSIDSSATGIDMSTDGTTASEPAEGLESGDEMMDLDLETLLETPIEVWTATKTKQTLDEAPAIVTVVTKEDIRRLGFRSLAEVLQNTVGFYVVDDHMLPNLGIRGVAGGFMGESGTVKVMIDGRSVAFRSTGGNWIGPELIPLSSIERIEIIRGPASALYGADAFLGVINIITVEGTDKLMGSIQAEGSINTLSQYGHDLDLTMGSRLGGLEIVLSGRTTSEDLSGLKLPDTSPSPDIPSYHDDIRTASHLIRSTQTALGKIAYHLKDDKIRIGIMGYVSKLEAGGEFSPWSQISYGLDDSGHLHGTTISLFQNMAGLDFDLKINDDSSLKFRSTYLQGRPTSDDQIDTGNDLYSIKRDFGYQTLENSLEGTWGIIKDLTAVLGTEFIYDWENLPSSLHVLRTSSDTQSAGEIQEASSTRQGDKNLYNLGAFAQLSWSGFKPWVDLTGGVRYDYHSIYGNQVSGRAAVVSNPTKMLFLKLLYGSAFKAPSPLLLYGIPYEVGDIIGNPDLKPQKVHTVEGQAILKPIEYVSFTTGVAFNWLIDKAEFVQRGINRVADNISKMKSLSWESELKAQYKEWIRGTVSFELQKTTREFDERESAYLTNLVSNKNVIYPSFILRADVSGKIPKIPIRLGMGVTAVGERPSSEMNSIENLGMYYLPSYVSLDASISTTGLEFVKGRETTISLFGNNLTDNRGSDAGFAGVDYPISPLTVFLQLRQEL
jgi:iron complex outermembrane receptor protein